MLDAVILFIYCASINLSMYSLWKSLRMRLFEFLIAMLFSFKLIRLDLNCAENAGDLGLGKLKLCHQWVDAPLLLKSKSNHLLHYRFIYTLLFLSKKWLMVVLVRPILLRSFESHNEVVHFIICHFCNFQVFYYLFIKSIFLYSVGKSNTHQAG